MVTLNKNTPAHFLLDPLFGNPRKRMHNLPVNTRIAYNIIKKESEFIIEFAAPGFSKSDFSINTDDGKLVVKLDKKDQAETKFISKEFDFSAFEKKFTLPSDVNLEKISASYELGVLKVNLPLKAKIKKEINIL